MKFSRWYRFKHWLVFKLLKGGIPIEVEARHGAFRVRKTELWKGGLVRVEIPLQKKAGTTSSPLGEIDDPQKLIDSATGVRSWPDIEDRADEIAKQGKGCLPYLTKEQQGDPDYREKRIREDDAKRRGKA